MLSAESEVRVVTFAQKHLPFTQRHTHLSHTCPQILNLQLTVKTLEGSGKSGLAPTTSLHRKKERKGCVSVLSLQNGRTKTRVPTSIVTQPHVCLAHTTHFNLRLKACGCAYTTPTSNYPSHISTCKCMTAHAASHTCIQHIQTQTHMQICVITHEAHLCQLTYTRVLRSHTCTAHTQVPSLIGSDVPTSFRRRGSCACSDTIKDRLWQTLYPQVVWGDSFLFFS